MMKHGAVLVFAKHPTAGYVNTRLCPPLTPAEAADLHRSCLQFTCQTLAARHETANIVVITPDAAADAFRRIVGPGWEVWLQGDGDLGRRMERNIGRAFDCGAKSVICLGADSPTLPPGTLDRALGELRQAPLVVGPCHDGGFYLLGLTRPVPGLFDGVVWGGSTVMDRLRANAMRLGAAVSELNPWYDIDRPEDVVRAATDLEQQQHTPAGDALLAVLRKSADAIVARGSPQELADKPPERRCDDQR